MSEYRRAHHLCEQDWFSGLVAEGALCMAWGLLSRAKADFPHTFSGAPYTRKASSHAAYKVPGTVLNLRYI